MNVFMSRDLHLKGILRFVFICILITVSVMVVNTSSKIQMKRADATIINMAGRQRMLNQRHAKETLLRKLGFPAEIEKTRRLFLSTVQALHYGGEIPLGGGKTALVVGIKSPVLEGLLRKQKALFEESIQQSDLIIASGDTAQLPGFIRDNMEIHKVAHASVVEFANESNTKVDQLLKFQYLAIFFIFLLCGFFWWKVEHHILKRLVGVSRSLLNSAEDSKKNSQSLDRGSVSMLSAVEDQASGLHATISAMTELNSMVNRTVEATRAGKNHAKQVSEEVDESKLKVHDMIETFNQVNQSVSALFNKIVQTQEDTTRKLSEVGEVIQGIGGKIGVITEIAQKTEILSFNASIEAARAGRHGKGFSVVATEVGNLARLTGQSSDDIHELLSTSRKKVESVSTSVTEQVGSFRIDVEACLKMSDEAVSKGRVVESSLNTVVSGNKELISITRSIDDACDEQKIGLKEIRAAMDDFQRSTDVFRSAAEENSVTATKIANTDLIHLSGLINQSIVGKGSHFVDPQEEREGVALTMAPAPAPVSKVASTEPSAEQKQLYMESISEKLKNFAEDSDDGK
ncbi:MAG: methyl-accepting chemotaxis protein [Zetaproteobacteria bacterium]|nr:methyl-accepting chemotaxis protein [Zetaproteobacteria bacterium]